MLFLLFLSGHVIAFLLLFACTCLKSLMFYAQGADTHYCSKVVHTKRNLGQLNQCKVVLYFMYAWSFGPYLNAV
jgi:hypothetical protein